MISMDKEISTGRGLAVVLIVSSAVVLAVYLQHFDLEPQSIQMVTSFQTKQ